MSTDETTRAKAMAIKAAVKTSPVKKPEATAAKEAAKKAAAAKPAPKKAVAAKAAPKPAAAAKPAPKKAVAPKTAPKKASPKASSMSIPTDEVPAVSASEATE